MPERYNKIKKEKWRTSRNCSRKKDNSLAQKETKDLISDQFDESSLKIAVRREFIPELKERAETGHQNTYLAMKSLNSVMIGTSELGLKLIENQATIYSELFMKKKNLPLHDMIYVDHLDCYFLLINYKIYRKDINSKPPYLWIHVRSGRRVGSCFRYSKMNMRMVIAKGGINIAFLDKKCSRIVFEVDRHDEESFIRDYKFFGGYENKIIAITHKGDLLTYVFNYDQKKLARSNRFKFDLIQPRRGLEQGFCIAVCKKDRLVLVGTRDSSCLCRMLILKFNPNSLVLSLKGTIYLNQKRLGSIYPLECFGYCGEHVLWLGLSSHDAVAYLFDYDTETEVLKELEDKRCSHHEIFPYQMIKFEENFYYTGKRGRVMVVRLEVKP